MTKQHVTIRLPVDLIKWIDREAKKQHRTRTNFIEKLLLERKDKGK